MNRQITGFILATAVCTLLASSPACKAQAPLGPVRIEAGSITGTPAWGWGVRLYRGIPYAAPPVGPLRWRAPQPVMPWQGLRAADHFGPRCMQIDPAGSGQFGAFWDEPGTSEMSE